MVLQTKGNPIIFIDDDENLDHDFVEYMIKEYDPNYVKGWFVRIFNGESYWNSILKPKKYQEVDYVGTGGMVLDRKIFEEEPILQKIPAKFAKVEDLYLSYLARKRGLKLMEIEQYIHIDADAKDQWKKLYKYKERAFKKLRAMGWKLLREK